MSSEWDQAQRLIDRGICTLDQVREAVAYQDYLRRRGEDPPPLLEVLRERGYVTPDRVAEAGLAVGEREPDPGRSEGMGWTLGTGLLAGGAGLVLLVLIGIRLASVRAGREAEGGGAREASPEEAAARAELEDLGRLETAARDFENAEEVIRRYRAFMGRQAGRRGELEAHARLTSYRQRLEARARQEWEALLRREAPLEAAGCWAERLRLYRDFPPQFLNTTEAGAEVAARREEISRRMEEIYLREREAALECLERGSPEGAAGHVEAMGRAVPGGREEEVASLRARIEGERRSAAARLRREIADEYLGLDGRFREALGRRNPREAAAVVMAFLFRPRSEEARRVVRVEGVDYEALRGAVEAWRPEEVVAIAEGGVGDVERPDPARSALMDLRSAAFVGLFLDDASRAYRALVESGQEVELPSLGRGRFERREGKVLFRAEGRPPVAGELGGLREDDLEALAARSIPEGPARAARAGFFRYYCGKGGPYRAYALLEQARGGGIRGIRPYLADLAAAVEAERGRELEIKFGAAEDCLRRGEWVTGKALLEELRNHSDHPFLRGRADRMERMASEIAQALLREKRFEDLYRGRVEALGSGGAVRVTYDFRDPAQMEAFEMVGTEERIRGRWMVRPGGLESSPETAAVRWRTPVRGDVEVEFGLTPLEAPQNIVVALYNRKGAACHYAVVFGFDWIGRSEGDPDDTAEDRFGMPRMCVIKYPVRAEKVRWREEDSWASWKSRLVGKALDSRRLEAGKEVRVRVERRGAGIRVEADGKGIWEGEDGEYTEGHLLFFSDCRCRLGPLRITFTP